MDAPPLALDQTEELVGKPPAAAGSSEQERIRTGSARRRAFLDGGDHAMVRGPEGRAVRIRYEMQLAREEPVFGAVPGRC